MTILIVDDESYNQEIVTLLLQRQGFSVMVAENGEDALKKIAENDFDLVFMDIQMPVLGGLETTKILRACENGSPEKNEFEKRTGQTGKHLQGKHIPVIAVTGDCDEQSERKYLNAGMDSVLSKPFGIASVNTALEQFGHTFVDESPYIADTVTEEKKDLSAAAMEFLKMRHPLNDEMLKQLLDMSVQSLRQSLKDTTDALGKDDFLLVASGAHKIKGILLALGVDDGVELCRSLQVSAEQKQGSQSGKTLTNLKTILNSLLRNES